MSHRTHRQNVRSMRFENLEDRRLMAGSVDIHLDGANLEVIGTADRDKLSVFYDDSGQTIHVKAYEYVGGYWVESQHREFDADDIAFIRIRGAGDDDVIYNSTEKDSEIFGGAGNDWISGGAGVDSIYGKEGDDTIYGNGGDDYLRGDEGDDYIKGNKGDDVVDAGQGDDYVVGGQGDDILMGSFGNDTLKGRDGNDALIGHSGNDRIYGEAGDDTLLGMEGNDWLAGGHGDDVLRGGSGRDTLLGNLGDDRLYGESGTDYLKGQDGNDYLNGGSKNSSDGERDYMWGGPGADTFVQHWHFRPSSANRPFVIGYLEETIYDFNGFAGDRYE
ncbi:Bifunctional hemolysin/adenylate cyclase precursor [Symmachiella dynata]|uniref:calcium-binding protein n=1 Tax=Symmachiella dynata TaxID=2527995 RepID=UPI00118B414B|nr:calcium-binding protein [Symmachiella dynata]QDT50035.1 Bifunctional hemolysin/adenylate cyclase precursor [Symmachiella dynata]